MKTEANKKLEADADRTLLAAAVLTTRANVYYDGKCISHSLLLADGTRKSVGVLLSSTLTFQTSTAETL